MIPSRSLDHLESSDLVRKLPDEDLSYSFKHSLVQETTQQSLLKNQRRRLHRLVAESLEALYPDRLDEFAVVLFQHCDAAGVDAKTIAYGERVGDAAMRIAAYDEASRAFARGLELASARAGFEAEHIRLMTRLGRVYELQTRYDDALALYSSTRDAARERNDRALELAALVQIAAVYAVGSIKYDPVLANRVAEEALALANALNDQHAEAKILWAMMLSNLYAAGGASAGLPYGERSLALARALHWREQMAYTLNDLFYIYLNLGELARARESAAEALVLWRELDNKPMLTDNLNAVALSDVLRGKFDEGLKQTETCLAICEAIENTWGEATAYMIQGYSYLERGDFAHARTALELCVERGDRIGIKGQAVMARFGLARLWAYLGNYERARRLAYDAAERTSNYALDWNAWAYATIAYVEMARGDWDAAGAQRQAVGSAPPAHYFERSLPAGAFLVVLTQVRFEMHDGNWTAAQTRMKELLARLRRSDFQIFLPGALNELARVFIGQDERERAQQALEQAAALADALDLRAARFDIALTRLELDRETDADARRALDTLLEFIPGALRDSFLNTPHVARVLQNA